MIKQIWQQLFGPQATGWAGPFYITSDGSRDKYAVEAIAHIHKGAFNG
jgi:hypothetical protein